MIVLFEGGTIEEKCMGFARWVADRKDPGFGFRSADRDEIILSAKLLVEQMSNGPKNEYTSTIFKNGEEK